MTLASSGTESQVTRMRPRAEIRYRMRRFTGKLNRIEQTHGASVWLVCVTTDGAIRRIEVAID